MEMTSRLDFVTSIDIDPGSGKMQVSLDRMGTLLMEDSALVTELRYYLTKHALAVVAFDEDTRHLLGVYPAVEDIILALSDPNKRGPIVVHAMKSPSLYELHREHPRFAKLYQALRDAHQAKAMTGLAVFPGTKRILDVRVLSIPENQQSSP